MAGTATQEDAVRGVLHGSGTSVIKKKIAFVADGSDGSFPDAVVSNVGGYLVGVYVTHGTTTPTTAYDLYIKMDGIDLLGGAGEDIASAADAIITPQNTLGDSNYPGFAGDLTVSIANNSVNSAELDVYLVFTA